MEARTADTQTFNLVSCLAFLAAAIISIFAIEALDLSPALRPVVALLPVPFFALFILAQIRLIRQLDELQQRIHLETLAIAYPTAILLVYAVGMLERAGFHIRFFENPRDLWPLVLFPYFLALLIARRRYA